MLHSGQRSRPPMLGAALLLLLHATAARLATPPRAVPLLPRIPPPRAQLEPPPRAAPPPPTGDLLGATALVAGTTIGAGIIALPAKTIGAGFAPSAAALVLAWAYMAASALLIAEVNVNTLCALDKKAVSIDSMAEETLGPAGAKLSGLAYVFIHYALLVAYMLQGGSLLFELAPIAPLPAALAAPAFAALAGGFLLFSPQRVVERVNALLVGGVLLSFVALLATGVPQVDLQLLAHADAPQVVPAVPVIVLALVFHNVVPTVSAQLGCDLPRIRQAILVGSAIPTLMFIAWSAVILGSVPPDAALSAAAAGEQFDPLVALRSAGDTLGQEVAIFSLLAVVTSFIGFVYGLVDFWSDALGWDEREDLPEGAAPAERPLREKAALYGLTLLPPLAVAEWDPSLFFAALDNAGTYGILILFGIIPAAMAWQQRYSTGPGTVELVAPEALPGGRASLALMALAAASVIGVETFERLQSFVPLLA
ncbi:hypothetical protein AB1Y20_022030 [Prymnesium parvum]|uniref:Tyrosine-specific transport protein n=1 Tax=Prymnesium parvum TaxID=97485 RepID=A0AB34JHK5_PRYPA